MKTRVLVIEPVADRAAMMGYLMKADMECTCVGTAAEAITCMEKSQYSALILGTSWPGMDGRDAVASIRKMGFFVPILVLSYNTDVYTKIASLDAGADDYLTKPFHPEELIARIHAIIRSRQIGYEDACKAFGRISSDVG